MTGLNSRPFVSMDVYQGNIGVYEVVCTPLLQPDGVYGCKMMEAWSYTELQRIPAVGLSDLATIALIEGTSATSILAVACRKSHASISSYDQSAYNVPSFTYRWNATSSSFDLLQVCFEHLPAVIVQLVEVSAHALNMMMMLLQVLGEDFRSIASRTGMADRSTKLHRAFCLPECKLAPDNYTVSVKFLRGATGKRPSALYRPSALPCVSCCEFQHNHPPRTFCMTSWTVGDKLASLQCVQA